MFDCACSIRVSFRVRMRDSSHTGGSAALPCFLNLCSATREPQIRRVRRRKNPRSNTVEQSRTLTCKPLVDTSFAKSNPEGSSRKPHGLRPASGVGEPCGVGLGLALTRGPGGKAISGWIESWVW